MESGIVERLIRNMMSNRSVRRILEIVLVDRLKTRGYVDVEFLMDRFSNQALKKSKNFLVLNILGIKNSIANNNTTQNAEKNNINEQAKPEQETHQLKRKITFKEAQQQIKDFKIVLEDIEKKIKNKFGDCLPDFSYEEHLPVTLKTKLITSFFESEEIKNIINKVNQEQKSSN